MWKSSIDSNTTARPRCFMSAGVAAEGLMIAPSGARLPRSTRMPVFSLKGFLKGKMTSRFQQGASLTFSQIDLPFTVKAFLWRSLFSPSSRSTTGRPPA
ncbi:hypothetical protein D3C83_67730 [compost metagenome]